MPQKIGVYDESVMAVEQVIRDFMRQYIEENEAANDTVAAKKQKGHS